MYYSPCFSFFFVFVFFLSLAPHLSSLPSHRPIPSLQYVALTCSPVFHRWPVFSSIVLKSDYDHQTGALNINQSAGCRFLLASQEHPPQMFKASLSAAWTCADIHSGSCSNWIKAAVWPRVQHVRLQGRVRARVFLSSLDTGLHQCLLWLCMRFISARIWVVCVLYLLP